PPHDRLEGRHALGDGAGIEASRHARLVAPDALTHDERGDEWRPRQPRHGERTQLEARPPSAEDDLVSSAQRSPRLELDADDLTPAERSQDRKPTQHRAVGVDDVEAVAGP